jgi:hypothetical protein
MTTEVCKTHPDVKILSVENDSWKTAASSTKPLFDQRTRVYVGSTLYFAGYPYSQELSRNQVRERFNSLTNYRFFESNEGTMIRVFNIHDTWYTGTNKKLDAFVSKWSAKHYTFGMQVANAVKTLLGRDDNTGLDDPRGFLNSVWDASLQKDKKYLFLLRPCEEEKLVCETSSNRLINIGVLDAHNNLSLDADVKLSDGSSEPVCVPRPRERTFNDSEELLAQLDLLDPTLTPGFIAIGPSVRDEDGADVHVVKVVSDRYRYASKLRNNVPSLNFRYLQLEHLRTIEFLHDPESPDAAKADSLLADFLELYHTVYDPAPVRSYIWNVVVKDLFHKYQQIYISHTHLDLLPKTARVLSIIHNEYLEARFFQKTDHKRIADILACIKPTLLNQLIREFQDEERRAQRIARASKLDDAE